MAFENNKTYLLTYADTTMYCHILNWFCSKTNVCFLTFECLVLQSVFRVVSLFSSLHASLKCVFTVCFLGHRLYNGSPYAIGPLFVLSVHNVGLLWPNGWINQDATWYGGRSRPRRHCVRWGPSSHTRKGHRPAPNFRPMSVVAKRLDGSRCHLVRR